MSGSHISSYSLRSRTFAALSQGGNKTVEIQPHHTRTVYATCVSVIGTVRDENGVIRADEQFLITVLTEGATDEKFRICQELFTTERHYIDSLKLLLKIKDALIERVEKEKPIISKPKIVQIFGKVQPIVDLHEEISQKLEELIENWNDKKCDVAKIWLDANNKLLRVYPSYINFCDDARSLLLDACQRYPRLRTFVKEQEKLPEFHRQKATDIMTFPVQRLAGVKLLLERLEKKSNRNNSELHLAIEGVGNVLKRSNTVRRESDAHIAQLNLLQQVENIPNGIVYASHSLVSAVEVHMLCSTNEIKQKNKDSVLKVTLFNDGLILVCSCRKYKLASWLPKTQTTQTLCRIWKKPQKYLTTLRVEQFRSIAFIHCARRENRTCVERSPVCCWKIREAMADTDWFVAVENFEDIDQFIIALDGVLKRRMSCFEHSCRASNFNSEMKLWEVPDECKDVVSKFLEARKFLVLEDDDRSEELGSALRRSKDHSGPSASRRRSLLSIFNEGMKRPKDKEKAAAKQRRRTIEPCHIHFTPVTENK